MLAGHIIPVLRVLRYLVQKALLAGFKLFWLVCQWQSQGLFWLANLAAWTLSITPKTWDYEKWPLAFTFTDAIKDVAIGLVSVCYLNTC